MEIASLNDDVLTKKKMMKTMIKQFLANGKIRRLLWAALVFAIMISGWRALTLNSQNMSVFVRVSMKSPESGQATLYYDVGQGFNSRHVSTSPVYGDYIFHEVKLKIPLFKKLHHLRFDPPLVPDGLIVINKVDIVDRYGNVLHNFNLNDLKPANQIKKFDFINGNIQFSTDENSDDPQINFLIDRTSTFNRLQLFAAMFMYHVIPGFFIQLLIFVLLIYIWSKGTDSVVVLAILVAGLISYYDSQSVYFRLSMKSMLQGDTAELYYDQGYGLFESNVVKAVIHEDNLFHEYKFKIPRNISSLRFDPLKKEGLVVIKKMEITDRFGNVLKSFKPHELVPAWEIKTFEFLEEGLKVKTTDMAKDPQISIVSDDVWQSNPRSLLFSLATALIEWSVILALLIISILVSKRYKERIFRFIDGAFFQEKLPVIYLGCAFGLILAMVFLGNRACHPDEWGHMTSASYYMNAWLPKSVDNPEVVKTVSGWGVSYLFRTEAVYWFAGKFSAILSVFVNDDYLRARLFNAALFLILVLIVARKTNGIPLLSLPLVVSPQIWYIFSYFNGDAFAFFVSMLIAWQLIDTDSITNQYLNSTGPGGNRSGGLLFGVLIGFMLLSKMNYYVYIVFILFVTTWRFISGQGYSYSAPERIRLCIKKGIFITGVALCVSLPPVAYDQYVNDFKKQEKILTIAEHHAQYEFKPSTMRNDLYSSYRGLHQRDKGVSLKELILLNPEWRNMTFMSFFGLYGNMDYPSDRDYYQVVTCMLVIFFVLVSVFIILAVPIRDMVFLLFVLFFICMAIGQSVYYSWVNDYQPQGRYIFMILPMLMIGLTRMPAFFRTRVNPFFCLAYFLLSISSFLWTAIRMIPKLSGCG